MKVIRDGNAFAVVRDDFVNLQESLAYFFEEKTMLLAELDVHGLDAVPPELWPQICEALEVDPREIIKEHLKVLASGLDAYDDALDVVEDAKINLESTDEWKELETAKEHSASIKTETDYHRQVVNALTVLAYEQSGEKHDKKPVPGVGIRVSQVYRYDDQAAKNYCLAELPEALKLDGRIFEKYVKGVQDVKPLDFVTSEEKVTPTIAADLSEYLKSD